MAEISVVVRMQEKELRELILEAAKARAGQGAGSATLKWEYTDDGHQLEQAVVEFKKTAH